MDLVERLLSCIGKLTLVFRGIIAVLATFKIVNPRGFWRLAERILGLLDNPMLSHLQYYRVWILSLYHDGSTPNSGRWQVLYDDYNDALTRRQLILAMGFANEQAWVRTKKNTMTNWGPW